MAIGDAFGCQLEDKRLTMPPFPTFGLTIETELKGGGPRGYKAGQVGTDVQIAAATGWCLRHLQRFDLEEMTQRYKLWRAVATKGDEQTVTVLDAIQPYRPETSRVEWHRRNRRWMGNGALARSVVLAVALSHDETARRDAVLADTALTHFDFRCQLSALALSGSLAEAFALDDREPTAESMANAAEREINTVSAIVGRRHPDFVRELTEAVEAVREDLALARAEDPRLYGPEFHMLHHKDSVRVTFRLAYWELFHASSAEAGLLDVVHRGGDTETNGAITGALLGARYGEESLRKDWKETVLGALESLKPEPFWDTYHPRHLLALADWD